MKPDTFSLLLSAILLPAGCLAQSPVRLAGIINVAGTRSAVVEVVGSRYSRGPEPVSLILREDEREDTLEIKSIDPTRGIVEMQSHGTNFTLTLPTMAGANPPAVLFTNTALPVVLKFYAELTGLTLLQHPGLKAEKFSITSTITDRAALAGIFAAALTNAGVVSIPDGDKFLRILPATSAEKIQRIQIPSRELGGTSSGEKYPAGAIDFIAATVGQAARFHAELLQGKIETPMRSPNASDITFRNQQPFTRAELIYALDVHLAWRGLKLVRMNDEFVHLVPLENQP